MRPRKAGKGNKRQRSTKRSTPDVRLEQGLPQPQYLPGLLPAEGSRTNGRMQIKILEPEPRAWLGALESAEGVRLAAALVAELQLYIKYGPDAPFRTGTRGEHLEPVLKRYARALQEDWESNLAFGLADVAWEVIKGLLKPAKALELAQRARSEASWRLGSSGPVSVEDVAAAARGSKRGPSSSPLSKAARVYAALAWNSRARVQPIHLDARRAVGRTCRAA